MDPRDPVNPVDTVAWRAPEATRFDGRPANDASHSRRNTEAGVPGTPDTLPREDVAASRPPVAMPEPLSFGRRREIEEDEPIRPQRLVDIPAWAWAVFGAVIAALAGAMAGQAFQVI